MKTQPLVAALEPACKLDTQKYPNLSRGAYVRSHDAEGVKLTDVTIVADGYINCKSMRAKLLKSRQKT